MKKPRPRQRMTPLGSGFLWALVAAVAFGVTTPLVARFGRGAGPWTTAALLYAGAAAFALPLARDVGRVLRMRRARTILLCEAIVGAALAPAALAYGLRSSGALAGSLALNAEVPFSVALAALIFREYVPRRIVVACGTIALGAALLVWNGNGTPHASVGLLFVTAAALLWAIDNALSSLLVDVPFATTIAGKATCGALIAELVAVALHEPAVAAPDAVALALVGAVGYGASLWAYLRAQRTFGIARTASTFALAPFIGAAVAFALGERDLSGFALVAFALVAFGAYLHATERHAHRHAHEAADHDHPHVHDDEHHAHVHDDLVTGEHAHRHAHMPVVHDHAHASDPEHLHVHGNSS